MNRATLMMRVLLERRLLYMSAMCLVAFAALATWVAVDETLPGERRTLVELRDAIGDSLDDVLIAVRDATHTAPLAGAAAAIAVATFAMRRRSDALFFAAAFALTVILNPVLKEWVGRARPQLWPPLVDVSPLSFPSGHATNSAALVFGVVLLVAQRHRRIAAAMGAAALLVVALSQLGLGVHYPSDIVGGWLWAGACTSAAWSLRGRRRHS